MGLTFRGLYALRALKKLSGCLDGSYIYIYININIYIYICIYILRDYLGFRAESI